MNDTKTRPDVNVEHLIEEAMALTCNIARAVLDERNECDKQATWCVLIHHDRCGFRWEGFACDHHLNELRWVTKELDDPAIRKTGIHLHCAKCRSRVYPSDTTTWVKL